MKYLLAFSFSTVLLGFVYSSPRSSRDNVINQIFLGAKQFNQLKATSQGISASQLLRSLHPSPQYPHGEGITTPRRLLHKEIFFEDKAEQAEIISRTKDELQSEILRILVGEIMENAPGARALRPRVSTAEDSHTKEQCNSQGISTKEHRTATVSNRRIRNFLTSISSADNDLLHNTTTCLVHFFNKFLDDIKLYSKDFGVKNPAHELFKILFGQIFLGNQ